MTGNKVLLHGGPCHGMEVVWGGCDELRMVKCLRGFAPWPSTQEIPVMDHVIYRPSIDSPSIFVFSPRATVVTEANCNQVPVASGHPYR